MIHWDPPFWAQGRGKPKWVEEHEAGIGLVKVDHVFKYLREHGWSMGDCSASNYTNEDLYDERPERVIFVEWTKGDDAFMVATTDEAPGGVEISPFALNSDEILKRFPDLTPG